MAPGSDPHAAGSSDLLARLAAWAAAARADEAAAARGRERWLRQASEESASVTGVLFDLAERAAPVVVATVAGRRHRALIEAVGADFIGLRLASGAEVLLATAAVSWVRQDPRADRAAGDRNPGMLVSLGEALAVLAEDRPRVLVVPTAGAGVAGELRSVGRDVVVLRLDGAGRPTAYVPLATITEVASM